MQVLNSYGKVYPTPPPSRRPIRVKKARLAAERAAQEGGSPAAYEQGTALEETDKAGRHKLGIIFLRTASSHTLPLFNLYFYVIHVVTGFH